MNDFKVYRMFKSSIKLVDDHYELPLPWKYEGQVIPNNKNLALNRLNHLKRKLMRNSDLKQKYSIQIQTMLDKNYAELVHDNFQITSKKVWYEVHSISFQTFFVQAFIIAVNSRYFSMLLLYSL